MGGLKVVTQKYKLFRIAGSSDGSESLRETATTATAGDSTLSLQQVPISIFPSVGGCLCSPACSSPVGAKKLKLQVGFQLCCFDRRLVYSPSVENLHWIQPPLQQTTCFQNKMVWLFVSSQRGLDTISIIRNIGPIYVESSST